MAMNKGETCLQKLRLNKKFSLGVLDAAALPFCKICISRIADIIFRGLISKIFTAYSTNKWIKMNEWNTENILKKVCYTTEHHWRSTLKDLTFISCQSGALLPCVSGGNEIKESLDAPIMVNHLMSTHTHKNLCKCLHGTRNTPWNKSQSTQLCYFFSVLTIITS